MILARPGGSLTTSVTSSCEFVSLLVDRGRLAWKLLGSADVLCREPNLGLCELLMLCPRLGAPRLLSTGDEIASMSLSASLRVESSLARLRPDFMLGRLRLL
jgi:hypothetical protein